MTFIINAILFYHLTIIKPCVIGYIIWNLFSDPTSKNIINLQSIVYLVFVNTCIKHTLQFDLMLIRCFTFLKNNIYNNQFHNLMQYIQFFSTYIIYASQQSTQYIIMLLLFLSYPIIKNKIFQVLQVLSNKIYLCQFHLMSLCLYFQTLYVYINFKNLKL